MMLGRELAETTSERAAHGAGSRRDDLRALRGLSARPATSRRSISRCAAAKWSAWPACSARAAPKPRGCCSAPSAPTAAAPTVDGKPVAAAIAARRDRRRASASAPKTARPRASSPISSVRENIVLALQARRGLRRAAVSRASRTRSRTRYIRLLDIRPPDAGEADRAAVRRQPAEGAARPLAGDRPAPPDPRRADARHRCRRPCRDHPPDPRTLRRRHGAAGDLLRARGDRGLLPTG